MSPQPLPSEPLSALVEAAAAMRELYLAYRQVGFSESEACAILGTMAGTIARGGNGEDTQ